MQKGMEHSREAASLPMAGLLAWFFHELCLILYKGDFLWLSSNIVKSVKQKKSLGFWSCLYCTFKFQEILTWDSLVEVELLTD